jgi:hypothetical protein
MAEEVCSPYHSEEAKKETGKGWGPNSPSSMAFSSDLTLFY